MLDDRGSTLPRNAREDERYWEETLCFLPHYRPKDHQETGKYAVSKKSATVFCTLFLSSFLCHLVKAAMVLYS